MKQSCSEKENLIESKVKIIRKDLLNKSKIYTFIFFRWNKKRYDKINRRITNFSSFGK
jgi:hypothetical protein